jgi:hypothetical protein
MSHESPKASTTVTSCKVSTCPDRAATGKVNQSSECEVTISMSSRVAKWLRSGA